MTTIGVLGGMSAASTQLYYAEIEALQTNADRDDAGRIYCAAAVDAALNRSGVSSVAGAGR